MNPIVETGKNNLSIVVDNNFEILFYPLSPIG